MDDALFEDCPLDYSDDSVGARTVMRERFIDCELAKNEAGRRANAKIKAERDRLLD